MIGTRRPLNIQRLSKDLADVVSYNFTSSSAIFSIYPNQEENTLNSGLDVYLCIYEGPYRGGHYKYFIEIPTNYPFKSVEIWARVPIWHPNIDLRSGRVALPLQWSPVLTLVSVCIAIQMIMLEPSSDSPLNLEACSYYCSDTLSFDNYVQRTLKGCQINNVPFPNMCLFKCQNVNCIRYYNGNSNSANSIKFNSPMQTSDSQESTILNSKLTKKRGYSLEVDDSATFQIDENDLINNSNNDKMNIDLMKSDNDVDIDDLVNIDILRSFKRMKYDEDSKQR